MLCTWPLKLETVPSAVDRLKVLWRAQHLQPSVDHDSDPLRERVRLLHVVSRQDECTAAPRLGLDSLPEKLARANVYQRGALRVNLHIHSSVYLYTYISWP